MERTTGAGASTASLGEAERACHDVLLAMAGRLPNALRGGKTGTGAVWLIPETDLEGFQRPKPGWPAGRPRGEVAGDDQKAGL